MHNGRAVEQVFCVKRGNGNDSQGDGPFRLANSWGCPYPHRGDLLSSRLVADVVCPYEFSLPPHAPHPRVRRSMKDEQQCMSNTWYCKRPRRTVRWHT
jgi:hypothetical protein